MNDTELTQRGGLFTEERWHKQTTAEILATNIHMNIAKKTLNKTVTAEQMKTPAVRAITKFEEQQEIQVTSMITLATKTPTEICE